MRRSIAWFTAGSLLVTQTSALCDPHAEGVAAGQAANPIARSGVSASSATAAVPGYTASPAERTYYRQPSLASQGTARLAGCLATPSDPVCQGLRTAMDSANTPRPAVDAHDPAVLRADAITRSPSSVLTDLSSYYSGCTISTVTTSAGTQTRTCVRYQGVGEHTMRRDLTVQVELTPNCTPGDWFAHGQANRNATDYIVADAQCRIRADGLQNFRFHAAGMEGACIDWQYVTLPAGGVVTAQLVADLSPHWSGFCWSPFKVVLMPDSGCAGGTCHYDFQFGEPVYSCRAGLTPGNALTGPWGNGEPQLGPPEQCFSLAEPDPELGCPVQAQLVTHVGLPRCATFAGPATLVGAHGWAIPLTFTQPAVQQAETDVWDDHQANMPAGGRCTPAGPSRCVDGPATKLVDGRPITRACWSYEQTVSCSGTSAQSSCAPLAAQSCTLMGSTCRQYQSGSNSCEIYEDSYSCASPAQSAMAASSCPSTVFCFQGSCFDISRPNDPDFGRSMSLMEAAREAGVYLDPTRMQVFKGEPNRCRDRLLKNCCYADGAGSGMTNQSLFGSGSRLVYDILMNAENQQFVYQGLSALLLGGGFSGSFTAYGVTVAVNGAAIPAGSVAVYSSQSMIVAFDPWSLVIAVIIYIILSMMSCNEEEGKLAMKEGARLCHTVGTWCSTCLMVLGHCVSCTEHTTGKCCFNSMLARIVNEQGRAQLGKGWGAPENPDCSGFTVAQLQTLNFASMDLSGAGRLPRCYYGRGRCQ